MAQTVLEGSPIEHKVKQAAFLSSDLGKEVIEEYYHRVKKDYNDNYALREQGIQYIDGVVVGATFFSTTLVGQILKEQSTEWRIATPQDIEAIIDTGALNLGEIRTSGNTFASQNFNLGLVLHENSEHDSSNYGISKYLQEQIRLAEAMNLDLREKNRKIRFPLMVPLTEVQLVNLGISFEGIGFELLRDEKNLPYLRRTSLPQHYNLRMQRKQNGLLGLEWHSGFGMDHDLTDRFRTSHYEGAIVKNRIIVIKE